MGVPLDEIHCAPEPEDHVSLAAASRVDVTLDVFYRVERAGAGRLSDGGGPFGFDVTLALLVDDLVQRFSCDALAETGCFLGDTTVYLARRYPGLPVVSCDVDAGHAAFTAYRLAQQANASVACVDSGSMVADVCARYERPLFYLDAHWGSDWPLARELSAIRSGVAVIHDFDIGHPRFSFDSYDGIACGPQFLARLARRPARYFTPDPRADYPLPCLQVGRRAGVGVVVTGVDPWPLDGHPYLVAHDLTAEMAVME
jgi:hypothetical protein